MCHRDSRSTFSRSTSRATGPTSYAAMTGIGGAHGSSRIRPADVPSRNTASWEPFLLVACYRFIYADGFNRFYPADEHVDLSETFRYLPNVFRQIHAWFPATGRTQSANYPPKSVIAPHQTTARRAKTMAGFTSTISLHVPPHTDHDRRRVACHQRCFEGHREAYFTASRALCPRPSEVTITHPGPIACPSHRGGADTPCAGAGMGKLRRQYWGYPASGSRFSRSRMPFASCAGNLSPTSSAAQLHARRSRRQILIVVNRGEQWIMADDNPLPCTGEVPQITSVQTHLSAWRVS